jgi:hypothetical protein
MRRSLQIINLTIVTCFFWLYAMPLGFAGSPTKASACHQLMTIDKLTFCLPDYITKMNFFAAYSKKYPNLSCSSDWRCTIKSVGCHPCPRNPDTPTEPQPRPCKANEPRDTDICSCSDSSSAGLCLWSADSNCHWTCRNMLSHKCSCTVTGPNPSLSH